MLSIKKLNRLIRVTNFKTNIEFPFFEIIVTFKVGYFTSLDYIVSKKNIWGCENRSKWNKKYICHHNKTIFFSSCFTI